MKADVKYKDKAKALISHSDIHLMSLGYSLKLTYHCCGLAFSEAQ